MLLKINIITLLVTLLFTQSGYSKDIDTIAVLPFSGQGIDENELYLIETALRDEINKSNNFRAFEPTRMIQLLENNGIIEIRACNEITCAIFMGNILAINFITQCRVGKIERSYTINLRIIDVKNKEVVKDIAEYFSGSMSDLLNKIAPKIARTIVKTKLSDRKFTVNGKKEKHSQRDTSNPLLQSPHRIKNTDDKLKRLDNYKNDDYKYIEKETDEQKDREILNIEAIGIPDPVKTPGKVEGPRIVDIQSETKATKILDTQSKVNAPRIVDTQRKDDAPRIVKPPIKLEKLEPVEIPEPIVMSTNDLSNSLEKEPHQGDVNKETDRGIMDKKNRHKLRDIPRNNLKPEEIKKMILDNDFFCNSSEISARWSNPNGKYTTTRLAVLSGDKILIDSTTQLMWQSEGSLKRFRYNEINQYVIDINNSYFGGFNNWRLPTLEEAMSIVTPKKNNGLHISDRFSSTQNVIWTADRISVDYTMIVRFDKGQCNYGSTQHYPLYIRLVRSF